MVMVVVLLLGMVVAVAAAAANPSRAALGLLALPRRPSRLGDALGTPTTLSVLSMRPRRELRRTGRMVAERGAPESSFSRAAAARRLRTRRRRGAGSVAGVVVVVRCHESSSPPARVGQMLRLSLSLSLSLSHAAAALSSTSHRGGCCGGGGEGCCCRGGGDVRDRSCHGCVGRSVGRSGRGDAPPTGETVPEVGKRPCRSCAGSASPPGRTCAGGIDCW